MFESGRNSFALLAAALLVQQSLSQTIVLEVFLDSATCSSSCDFIGSDEPMAYFEVNGDGTKYIKCASYGCAEMESPSTSSPKYRKSFDCSSSQITRLNVCGTVGDDDKCGIPLINEKCLAAGGCDDLGCREEGCQITDLGFCRTGNCARTVRKTISLSNSDVSGSLNYRIQRSGFCPTPAPTHVPTTKSPTLEPTKAPTTASPTRRPTVSPVPTLDPTNSPSDSPTQYPTSYPTKSPTTSPSPEPTKSPVVPVPTPDPTTQTPSASPVTSSPASETMGIAAMVGIASGGVACLSAAFFFVYRRKYKTVDSAGQELAAKKAAMGSTGPAESTLGAKAVIGGLVPAAQTIGEAGDFVRMRVAFHFEGQEEDELSAKAGTILHVTAMVNENWAIGYNPETGEGGMIPKTSLEDPEEVEGEDEVTKML